MSHSLVAITKFKQKLEKTENLGEPPILNTRATVCEMDLEVLSLDTRLGYMEGSMKTL